MTTPAQPDNSFFDQLQQEYMLAQIVSSMPNNRDDMPDVSTPAPIRARWAHRLYQQGVRVHTELATHRIVAHPSGLAGAHGPREFQKIDQDKMLAMVQTANPALYEKIKAAREDHHGGDHTSEAMLKALAKSLPPEWIAKLAEAGAIVDDFGRANIPADSPFPHPDAPDETPI